MGRNIAREHGCVKLFDCRAASTQAPSWSASGRSATGFVRFWSVSDGRNIALVTYTCERGQESDEIEDCERLVRSIRFVGD